LGGDENESRGDGKSVMAMGAGMGMSHVVMGWGLEVIRMGREWGDQNGVTL